MHIPKICSTFALAMKKITFLIVSMMCSLACWAQDQWANSELFATKPEQPKIDYRLSLRAGMIMPDGKVDDMLGQKGEWVGPTIGGEFAMTFHPKWSSLRDWNGAAIGVALSYWKFDCTRWGAEDITGHAIAPYAFVEIPFYTHRYFEIGVRPGIGCSFITKTYYNTTTEENRYTSLQVEGVNRSVGSVFNFYFPEALYMNFPIRDGWSIGIAGGWYHMSNGSLRQPNSGYNMFMGELAVRYQPYKDEKRTAFGESYLIEEKEAEDPREYIVAPLTDDKKESLNAMQKAHCELELSLSGGARQVYYKDRQSFFCSEMQLAAYWRGHKIFRLGGGVDVFYDGAYTDRETAFGKTFLGGATQTDCWRVGLSVQPEFVIGKFTAGFHFGMYVFDPVKNREAKTGTDEYNKLWTEHKTLDKPLVYGYDLLNAGSAGYPDGWLYTQIVLRYRFPYHMFAQLAMKAHLTKVEFVSAGVGVYL